MTVRGVWAIVLAGGTGQRYGGAKQFARLGGRALVDLVLDECLAVAQHVVVALPAGTEWPLPAGVHRVDGGATRLDSTRAALAALPDDDDLVVLIQDSAHPLAPRSLYEAVIGAVRDGADAAVPGVPMVDAIKVADEDGWVTRSLPKAGVVIVQTPHAFRLGTLRRAHAGAPAGVEDSELVERAGGRIRVVPGDWGNVHVTLPEELSLAEAIVRGRQAGPEGDHDE